MVLFAVILVLVLTGSERAVAYSSGAPAAACSTLTPGHPFASQDPPGGYYIYSSLIDSNGGVYTPGTTYTLTLHGSVDFRGFMIQALQTGTTTLIGSFSTTQAEVKALSCSGNPTATVTHTSSNLKSSITVYWTAPISNGNVSFYYTVVQQFATFYAAIDSSNHRPIDPPVSSPAFDPPTTSSAIMSMYPVSMASSSPTAGGTAPSPTPTTPTELPSGCPATDKSADSSFPLTFGLPFGCSRHKCDIYVAMGPNNADPTFLDIYMEGIAAGWVAVGFSDSHLMANTDVVGCRVDVGGVVSVVDTWNPLPNYSPNQADATQDGVCTYSTNYNGGKISCLFSRYGSAIDVGEDLDWNADRYIIIGSRLSSNGGYLNLQRHTQTPVALTPAYNAFSHTNSPTTPSMNPPTQPFTIGCPDIDKNGDQPFSNYTFGVPAGCSRTSCDVYVTMAPNTFNSSFLDIYMEGAAAGWVAVGFSDSKLMANTDVIGCRVDNDDMVGIVDTWNPSPNYSPNQVDTSQDGVCPHSASYSNGRIRCLFSRYGPAIDVGMDLDLNTEQYIIYGRRTFGNAGDMRLLRHSETPSRTAELVNPFNVTGDAPVPMKPYPEKALLQMHGILMLLAWPIVATIAIFFASWMKPALPNGEWFQAHRALLIISLFIAAAGFIFPFVALARNPIPGLINFSNSRQISHFAIGIIVFLFQIANPIIAIFRCKPSSPNRWVFNLIHASFIGVIVEILAYVNVGIGLGLFTDKYTLKSASISLWIFIGYVCIIIMLEVVLHVVFTISAFSAPIEDRAKLLPTTMQWCFRYSKEQVDPSAFEMPEVKDIGDKKRTYVVQQEQSDRKQPSKDAPLRWAGTGILFTACLLVLVVGIMVIIG